MALHAAPASADSTPVFLGLGYLETSTSSAAAAVSRDGRVVVGTSNSSGFAWVLDSGGSSGTLGKLESMRTARAVDADGTYVAGTARTTPYTMGAARWSASSLTKADETAHTLVAYGITANGGVLVGQGNDGALRWTITGGASTYEYGTGMGSAVSYGVSGNGAVAVGGGTSSNGTEAFRWLDSDSTNTLMGLGDLSGGGFGSTAKAVNADGSVIVGWGTSGSGREAFRWEGGVMSGLGDLDGGGFESEALAASADGSVIVGYGTTGAGKEAFLWDSENGLRPLLSVLELAGLSTALEDWVLTEATGVAVNGTTITIVGNGTDPLGHTQGWYASFDTGDPVPEPATLVLLGTGLLGLAGLARRRRQ